MSADNAGAHEYPTRGVKPTDLDSTMVLAGECGGLSAVFEVGMSASMPGMVRLETEHGPLYLDPDEPATVLDSGAT